MVSKLILSVLMAMALFMVMNMLIAHSYVDGPITVRGAVGGDNLEIGNCVDVPVAQIDEIWSGGIHRSRQSSE